MCVCGERLGGGVEFAWLVEYVVVGSRKKCNEDGGAISPLDGYFSE